MECLEGYVRRAQLVFTTADIREEPKKKSLIQIWQSKSCKNEKHVRSVIKTENPLENTSSDTESDDEIGRIIVSAVNTGETDDEIVTIKINGKNTTKRVDSGCKKTLIRITEFRRLHLGCKLHQTNVTFTPYGTK